MSPRSPSHVTPARGNRVRCQPALGNAAPPTRPRIAAASFGMLCAVAFYAVAVPPPISAAPGRAPTGFSASYLVVDALRIVTGVAAAADPDSGEVSAFPAGGIRN